MGPLILVGDHDPVDGFSRMTRPPPHDNAFFAVLVEDVPDRLGFPGQTGDGPDAPAAGHGFRKPVYPVLPGAFTGCDGCPEHGGKLGVKG